jgi:16S rRNA (adenine1518-N6/adenine1519-N6)-dimethyltransferase
MSSLFSTDKSQSIKPKKLLGQNFLQDQNIIEKIIKTANLNKKDVVLEIGPGLGILTEKLALKTKKVIAIEKDSFLAQKLKDKKIKNVKIIEGDILEIGDPIKTPHKVVANIPYYLTSILIRKLLAQKNKPIEIILMIQKEVAKRICSKPPQMNILSVSVNYYANPKIIGFVSKNCFWPKPKVDSAIIKIIPKNLEYENEDIFFKLIKKGFSCPRKQLINNLSNKNKDIVNKWLIENKINPSVRAESLSVEDWKKLAKTYHSIEKTVKK